MNKIIFLDIDGVLNSNKYFENNYLKHKLIKRTLDDNIYDDVKEKMLQIDNTRVDILKEICDVTGAKIVISSLWKRNRLYPYIEKELIKLGLPIIDKTINLKGNRKGEEIKIYLYEHKVDNYVIVDDEVFDDFIDLMDRLIKTSYYDKMGLEEEHKEKMIKILGKRK